MSDSTLSKVWRWSVMTSPLLNAWRRLRRMGYPNHKSDALLAVAALPKPIDRLIRETVKRSKLWCNERAEIAQELIAHAQDAIEAERSTEDIVNTFGNPKRIAKLMRRSMKRKRPLYWRAYRNMKRATWGMALLLIVGYGSLAVRFYMGKPSIKRNYIAELNARNDGYSEDQKAWGVYLDVDLEWQRFTLRAWEIESAESSNPEQRKKTGWAFRSSWVSDIQDLDRDDPKYLEGVAMFRSFSSQLARVREASTRPIMGMPYWTDLDSIEVEPGIWEVEEFKYTESPESPGLLMGVLLPDLQIGRQQAKLLLFDAQIALEDGDSQRVVENIRASLGIGRQIGRGHEFLIGSLVAMAITELSANSLQEIVAANPDQFSRNQLVELSHVFVNARENMNISFKGESMMFDDILQRAYTDDGKGNGRLTYAGVKMLMNTDDYLTNMDTDDRMTSADYLYAAASPAALLAMDDRATERRNYQHQIQLMEQALVDGPESLGLVQYELDLLDDHTDPVLDSMVDMLALSNVRSVARSFRGHMYLDATLTMLAIEVFKHEHGKYPELLTELVPQYLPEVPADYFNPGHPIQYKVGDDGYLLYSAGTDGDLDGGVKYGGVDHQANSSLSRRFDYETVSVNGKREIERDEAGNPVVDLREAPDCDWILIDMRSILAATTGE